MTDYDRFCALLWFKYITYDLKCTRNYRRWDKNFILGVMGSIYLPKLLKYGKNDRSRRILRSSVFINRLHSPYNRLKYITNDLNCSRSYRGCVKNFILGDRRSFYSQNWCFLWIAKIATRDNIIFCKLRKK